MDTYTQSFFFVAYCLKQKTERLLVPGYLCKGVGSGTLPLTTLPRGSPTASMALSKELCSYFTPAAISANCFTESEEVEPTFAAACASNNPGVLRWPVDGEKCFRFWRANGTSCSNCIAACPLMPTE